MSDESLILGVDGEPALRHEELSVSDAQLLRQYRRFLERHNLKEALYCGHCWDRDLSDGCKAFVRPEAILIKCRCRERYFHGATI